ncbi:MAG: hypothetical protein NVS3B21_06920 [Acidimicrobiales bacterium]
MEWSVSAAQRACDGVVVVVPAADLGRRPLPVTRPPDVVVAGGETRSQSVRNGLAAIPDDVGIVVVHDAARPLAGPDLWAAAIAGVRDGADGAICAVAVSDTIKRVQDGRVTQTIDRGDLVAVQTPQAFDAAILRAAHAEGGDATDDGALVEARGGRVVVVPGSPMNLKVTHPQDLIVANALVSR